MEIVYVLTNPAMPGLVKIGYSAQEEASSRIAQLYTTGVPVPFTIEFACRVENAKDVEKALHIAFSPSRINPKREFFRIEAEQAIAILRLLHTEETTQDVAQVTDEVDQQSLDAAKQMQARRPNFNFEEMGVPTGSQIICVKTGDSATVVGVKKVSFEGEEMSLTAATRVALHLEYSVAPGRHWTFKGKLLNDIYEETYSNID